VQNCTFYNAALARQAFSTHPARKFRASPLSFLPTVPEQYGTFMSGFDSPALMPVKQMPSSEQPEWKQKSPVKINVINNSSTTVVHPTATTIGKFHQYVHYTCKWTVADNRITYQPLIKCDVL
jgi:hypothetical protein